MIIQKMLKNKDVTLKGLANLLGMKYTSYDEGYVTISYDQFETPSTSRVAAECRGVIFDEEFNIVCRPFDRFYNYGESSAPQHIDFEKAKIFDKVDGSIIKFWYDLKTSQWRTATSGRIYGESNISDHGITFNDLVYRALNVENDDGFNEKCSVLSHDCTYIFELTARENRVVTRYHKPELWYLAARENESGKYIDFDGTLIGASLPKVHDINSLQDCIDTVKGYNNYEEGFVVYYDGRPVLKIKSPQYLVAHLIKGEGLSVGRICNLVIKNEIDEYLSYFPEDSHIITPYLEGLNLFFSEMNKLFELHKSEPTIKDFVASIKSVKDKDILIDMYKGMTAKHSFSNKIETRKKDIIKSWKQS